MPQCYSAMHSIEIVIIISVFIVLAGQSGAFIRWPLYWPLQLLIFIFQTFNWNRNQNEFINLTRTFSLTRNLSWWGLMHFSTENCNLKRPDSPNKIVQLQLK